jgi:hypothetical protein
MSCAVLGLATVNPVTSNDPCRVVNLVQICFIKLKRILICEITAWLGADIAFILEALGRGERLQIDRCRAAVSDRFARTVVQLARDGACAVGSREVRAMVKFCSSFLSES